MNLVLKGSTPDGEIELRSDDAVLEISSGMLEIFTLSLIAKFSVSDYVEGYASHSSQLVYIEEIGVDKGCKDSYQCLYDKLLFQGIETDRLIIKNGKLFINFRVEFIGRSEKQGKININIPRTLRKYSG